MFKSISRNVGSLLAGIKTRFAFSIGFRLAMISTPLVLALSATAFAFPVTYEFTGHLTSIEEGPPFLSIDDQFSGSFTIDSNTHRSPVPDYATWVHYDSKSTVELTIGNRK